MKDPQTPKLDDPDSERARRRHVECLLELQAATFVRGRIVQGVVLANGVETPISHGLGRAPAWVCPGAPRGATSAGRIDEVASASTDRTQTVVLKASGWTTTITVDVAFA